jgi:hypothetical protein
VHHGERTTGGEFYFLGFRLSDGTSVVRAFWLESGELHRGIMTPPFVTSMVWHSVPEDVRPELTERVAAKLGLAVLSGGGRVTAIAPPDLLRIRQMHLSDYRVLRGDNLGNVPDPLVWVAEATGEWRITGGPASGTAEAMETYRYSAVVIDASTGRMLAQNASFGPLATDHLDAPSPTPTRISTQTEAY